MSSDEDADGICCENVEVDAIRTRTRDNMILGLSNLLTTGAHEVFQGQGMLKNFLQLNLSFSPSFSLGLGALGKVVNRFNGYQETMESSGNR